MGGRGSSSKLNTATTTTAAPNMTILQAGSPAMATAPPQQQTPQAPPPPAPIQPGSNLQAPIQASATLAQIAAMTDDQLAQAIISSRNVDMPNFLNDKPDATQKFVYQVGLNGAPTVMDQAAFRQFMQQNGIPQSQVLSRSVDSNPPYTASHIANIFRYSELNYIGGKFGGKMSGAGSYFDMNGGGGTGYGSGATITAVLNPATARVIDYDALKRRIPAFARSHPKAARAIGSVSNETLSVYALCMGFNVISGGPVSRSYHNVIDRAAVVVMDQ